MKLTPEILEATYELLRRTEPFRGWKLPEPDDVVFGVAAFKTHLAEYYFKDDQHHISVTVYATATIETLVRLMAHEMVHLRQKILGTETDAQHNAGFAKIAKHVCRLHHFDPVLFC